MSSGNDPVQPTPFEAPAPAPLAPRAGGHGSAPQRWVLPALAALLLVAAVVVFWLPGQVEERAPERPAAGPTSDTTIADPGSAAAAEAPAAVGPDTTPWNEAQLARLRKEAQDVLQQLLDIQFDLQERGIERWAPEAFAAVAATAAEGDELYRQREYEQATGRYRDGLDALQRLQETLPEEVDERLSRARSALEDGDGATAAEALDLAALMEPENAELPAFRDRLAALPRVSELLEQAASAESGGDLAAAQRSLEEATALDPAHQRAAEELERVTEAHVSQQFNEAMSEGYAALDDNRFDAARGAFRRADLLRGGSAEATSALQEVAAAETAARLADLKRNGAEHERREQWSQAVAAYEKAREIDPNILFAAEGLERSGKRARLDDQFRTAIDEPERMSDEKVARATEALLLQARRLSPRGPVLAEQIAKLEQLLALANTPIAVTLLSDMETEVILYKVARLGRFKQHSLELRPGKYTAVGQRLGYRDVRREFTVSHGDQPRPVTIACTERI
jgi:tetratricopeptide (TPR) repeat protein